MNRIRQAHSFALSAPVCVVFAVCALLFAAPREVRAQAALPAAGNPFSPCLLRTLALRFDSEMRSHRWAPIEVTPKTTFAPFPAGAGDPIPLKIELRDLTPANLDPLEPPTFELRPERMGRSGGMFSILLHGDALRFHGGLLRHPSLSVLEWQLLTDARDDECIVHLQLAAPQDGERAIELILTLGDAPSDAPPVFPGMPIVAATNATGAGAVLVLDPAEPRDCEPVAANVLRYRLVLTPKTGNFPRLATLAFTVRPMTAEQASLAPAAFATAFWPAPEETPRPIPESVLHGDFSGVRATSPCETDWTEIGLAPPPPCAEFDELERIAETRDGPAAAWADSALHFPARGPDRFPILADGILLVNPDPDIKTDPNIVPNRAAAILSAIDSATVQVGNRKTVPPAAVWLRFDRLSPDLLDHSRQALYLCDFPAVFSGGTFEDVWTVMPTPVPAVRLADAAAESVATLACLLRRRGNIPLLVSAPPRLLPFVGLHADAWVVADPADLPLVAPFAGPRPVLLPPAVPPKPLFQAPSTEETPCSTLP